MEQMSIQQEKPKKPVQEMMEEEFVKELYVFMRKRETPIERIPNLGFKQIDLFLMFKVVSELGGYYQVTTQQQWKQVYNTLGGNPRSTSAATCTRRHYEKLLLPFECHLTGKQVSVVPRTSPKHYYSYDKEQGDGQRPPKRRLLSMPLLQENPQILQSDLHEPIYPLTPYYAHPFHPSHAVLPPHVPISSSVLTPHSPPAPTTWFPMPPPHPNPTERSTEPLEQLRYLAEQYRTTSGLTEPLNLSVKAPRREAVSVPTSSFAPPSSNKSPKFLNKPSPLYGLHRQRAARDDGREPGPGDSSYGHSGKPDGPDVIPLEVTSASSSPSYGSAPTAGTEAGGPGEARDGGPEVWGLPFGHMLPRISRENAGKMEIEVPLSVFHNWLRQCGPSAGVLAAKEEAFGARYRSDAQYFPAKPTFHGEPRDRNSAAAPTAADHFSIHKHLLLGGILKNQDARPFGVNQLLVPKALSAWDGQDKDAQASGTSGNIDSGPCRVERDAGAASSSCDGATAPRAGGASHAGHAAVVGLNHSSTSLLQLTNEEVIKLRRIISSSL
ncbi:AT-rich interaction domain 6 [Spinachia spinachia]